MGKQISRFTEEELHTAVEKAAASVPDFWKIMAGVDAYMERRRRRIPARKVPRKAKKGR